MKTVIHDDDPFGGEWKTVDLFNIKITGLSPESFDEYPTVYMGPWHVRAKEKITDYLPQYGYGGLLSYLPNSRFDWLWLMLPLTPLEDVKLEAQCNGGRVMFPHLHFDEYHGIWKTEPEGKDGYHYMLWPDGVWNP